MFSLPFLCIQLLKNLKSLEFIIAHPTPKFPSYYITLIWTMETISILISLCLVFSQLESVNSRPPVSSLKKKECSHQSYMHIKTLQWYSSHIQSNNHWCDVKGVSNLVQVNISKMSSSYISHSFYIPKLKKACYSLNITKCSRHFIIHNIVPRSFLTSKLPHLDQVKDKLMT